MFRLALTALILPAILSAQAMVQYGVAAAGGTAAGSIMGKKLSDTLNAMKQTTDQAADQGEDADTHKDRKKDEWKRLVTGGEPAAAKMPAAPPAKPSAPVPAPAGNSRPRRTYSAPSAAQASSTFPWSFSPDWSPQPVRYTPAPAPPVEPSADSMRAVEVGTDRDHVIERLGTPLARVTIPEAGQFQEIYYYQAKGQPVGAVRLTGGEVTAVQLNQ